MDETSKQILKKIDNDYKKFLDDERKEFRKGNRDIKHATWNGNLW